MSDRYSQLRESISTLAVSVFLAQIGRGPMPALTLHTVEGGSRRRIARELRDAARAAGVAGRIRVRVHDRDALDRIGTLSELVRRFGNTPILHDPTGAIARARALVGAVAALRASLRKDLVGVYLADRTRALYVVLKPARFLSGDGFSTAALGAAEDSVHEALGGADCGYRSIRIGFCMPPEPAVPVDRASHYRAARLFARVPKRTLVAALTAWLGVGTVLAEGPAVSSTNTKFAVSGGVFDRDGIGLVTGSVTMPLPNDERLGLQIDAVGGVIDDDGVGGAGAQLFWRDPDRGLAGISGSYLALRSSEAATLTGKAEIYLNNFSILANGGYVFGDVRNRPRGGAELRWYTTNDLMLRGGFDYSNETDITTLLGFEYRPGISGLSGLTVFGKAALGNSLDAGVVGLRYYFGASKSLIDRHRKDDPDNEPGGQLLSGTGGSLSYGE